MRVVLTACLLAGILVDFALGADLPTAPLAGQAGDGAPTLSACDAQAGRADLLKAQIATVQAQLHAARAVTAGGQLQVENGKLWEEKLLGQEQALQTALDDLAKPPAENGNTPPVEENK